VPAIDDLENLPLSHLFSGPLIAAVDATIQTQSESMNLLLETGFDENGDLVTVAFNYTTEEIDPETGEERRVSKEIELPLLLFLTLPNLQVNRIEEEFSAEITQVEEAERTSASRFTSPLRLNVTPASQSTTFDRKTKSTFDLDIRMVAELQNESTGMEILERAVSNATVERRDEKRTDRIERGRSTARISPERLRERESEQ
jgi:hypothetical protein